MDAMTILPSTALKFIKKLETDYPDFTFSAGSHDSWSVKNRTITYSHQDLDQLRYSLLHELAHALLDHSSYGSDFELLTHERHAWEAAAQLAEKYGITIDQDHIEDCLDSYRDWLHDRSSCPSCKVRTFQKSKSSYHCYNCQTKWSVQPTSRFTRTYRRAI